MRVFRIVAKGAVAFYDELFMYMVAGLAHLLSWLLIIPGPFALAGIYTIGQRSVRGKGITWRMIWDGIKEFGPRSLLLFLLVAFGYIVIGSNLWFYNTPEISPLPPSLTVWLTPLFLLFGLIWTAITFYAQAFLMELEQPKFGMILRNSLFLTLLQPFQTLILLLVAGLSLVISIFVPLLLIVWPGFVSAVALTAVREMVTHLTEQAEARREAMAQEEAAVSTSEADEDAPEADEDASEADEDASETDEDAWGADGA